MRKKILWVLVSCLMVAALLLASCAPAVVEEEEEVAPVEVEEEVVVPAKEEPQYGGTITVLAFQYGVEPQVWDPAEANWSTDYFASPYMENLVTGDFEKYGPRGTNEFPFVDFECVPIDYMTGALAESWELPSLTKIIYHIRQGVYFPEKPGVMSSRELTADDIVFCINRRLDSPKFSPVHRPYYDYATAEDKYTVAVNMVSYYGNWDLLSGWQYFTKIYPPELVDAGIHDWKNATGTGPFMLVDYVSGASLTYEKNPNYWGKTTIDGKEYKVPFVDRMTWPIIVDESTRLAALRTGKCDINQAVSWRYKETLEETNPELLRYRHVVTTFGGLCGRMDEEPFDDINVRRALSMAIDREAIIQSQLGGEGEILGGPFSLTWPEDLYTPLEELPESAQELFEYNPTEAKRLMTEAGYPNGFSTKIQLPTGSADYIALVADYWHKHLGVELELEPLDYATYIYKQYSKTHGPMFYMLKGCGDPFQVLWACGTPGYAWNPAEWDDEYFIETYQQARSTPDVAEAKRLLKELNVYMIDQVPCIIMPLGYEYAYAWPWVHNWYGELNVTVRSPGQILARVWLDRDLRYEMIGIR